MIMKKLLGLINLTKAKIFYIYRLTEVVMVCKNKSLKLQSFKQCCQVLKALKIAKSSIL